MWTAAGNRDGGVTTSPGPRVQFPRRKLRIGLGGKEVSTRGFPSLFSSPFTTSIKENTLVHCKVPTMPLPWTRGDLECSTLRYANCVFFWSICLLLPPPQMQSDYHISQTPGSKPLTWELVAIARSKSGVASAIGCHKVGVALNTERKKELSDSGLGSGVIFQGRQQ